MGLMEGVQKINGIWKIRRRIPADCAAAFGVKEFYTRSLGTSDRKLAMQLAAPLLAEIDQRIEAIRAGASGAALSNPPKAFLPMDRQRAFEAIASWRRRTIQAASEQGWSGLLPPLDNDEAVRLSGIRMVLRTGGLPEGFDDRMAGALGVPVDHPVLRRDELREAFRSAWSDVEDRIDEFRHDRFDGWPEDEEPASTAAAPPASGVTLLDLFDLWAATKTLAPRQRGYVERLSEFLGAPDISRITPIDLDRFLVELRKWPNTKRDLSGMDFLAVISEAQREGTNVGTHLRLELAVVAQVLVRRKHERRRQWDIDHLFHQLAVRISQLALGSPGATPGLIHCLLQDVGLSFRFQDVVSLFEDERLAPTMRHLERVEKLALIPVLEEPAL